jgi:hypothetical protein
MLYILLIKFSTWEPESNLNEVVVEIYNKKINCKNKAYQDPKLFNCCIRLKMLDPSIIKKW